ncbi:MAG: hypothetical protein JWR21_1815 [Herminiimonas sp.]|nr:hypothetical protein [Herminiimonas sp.]
MTSKLRINSSLNVIRRRPRFGEAGERLGPLADCQQRFLIRCSVDRGRVKNYREASPSCNGGVAKGIRSGLQSRLHWFDSNPRLRVSIKAGGSRTGTGTRSLTRMNSGRSGRQGARLSRRDAAYSLPGTSQRRNKKTAMVNTSIQVGNVSGPSLITCPLKSRQHQAAPCKKHAIIRSGDNAPPTQRYSPYSS